MFGRFKKQVKATIDETLKARDEQAELEAKRLQSEATRKLIEKEKVEDQIVFIKERVAFLCEELKVTERDIRRSILCADVLLHSEGYDIERLIERYFEDIMPILDVFTAFVWVKDNPKYTTPAQYVSRRVGNMQHSYKAFTIRVKENNNAEVNKPKRRKKNIKK